MTTDNSRPDAMTKSAQFLTDVVTAAGLLSCGRTDKKLASRITEQAFELREHMNLLAASPVEQHEAAPAGGLIGPLRDDQRQRAISLYMSLPHSWDSAEAVITMVSASAYTNGALDAGESTQPEPPLADERAAFEMAYRNGSARIDMRRTSDGGYLHEVQNTAWRIWQAARASSPNAAGAEGQLTERSIEGVIAKATGEYRSGDSYTFEDVWSCVEVALSRAPRTDVAGAWSEPCPHCTTPRACQYDGCSADAAAAPAETRALPVMRNAFRVTEVSGDPDPAKQSFTMRFSFPSIEALHAADDEWNKFIAAAPADAQAVEAVAIPAGWTKLAESARSLRGLYHNTHCNPEGFRLAVESLADDAAKLLRSSPPPAPASAPDDTHRFKNFHRQLCERFGYVHDEIDWRRDQASLIEWIAKQASAPVGMTEPSLTNPLTPYGMLVRALRIVSGTILGDMAKDLLIPSAKLSAMEFGREPVTPEIVREIAAYFETNGVPNTLPALDRALLSSLGGDHD